MVRIHVPEPRKHPPLRRVFFVGGPQGRGLAIYSNLCYASPDSSMYKKNFSRDHKPGGWKGGKSFGGDRGGFKTMHPATCEQCGNRCEVPFKPNGRKPVYCSNCFVRDEKRDSRPSFDRGD